MAIYHFTVKVLSRAEGRNAVAGAAYRHGQTMTDQKTGQVFTKTTHQDVEHCEFSLPENAPHWVKNLLKGDNQKASDKFWNAVEGFEKRKDAQLYREVEFALPHELSKEQRLDLAREFIKDQFTSRGMIADWCVHNHFDDIEEIEKPHVHVMLTLRKAIERDDTIVEKLKSYVGLSSGVYFGHKVVDWNSKALLRNWREKWSEYANDHLAKAGLDIRIDHRSYEDQGIDLAPQPKLGKSVLEMSKRGLYVDRFEEMVDVQKRNLELIRKNPEIVLDYITRYQSTFTRQDIARLLNRYVVDSKEEFQHLFAKIEASSQLVSLNGNEQGEAVKLTTKDMIRIEKQLMQMGQNLASSPACSPSKTIVESSLEKGHEALKTYGGLSSDQVQAIHHMTTDGQLKIVMGYAGAGKTTCLDVAKEIWNQSGYRVVGAAPTGKAVSNLEDLNLPSKTLHKWEHEWKKGREMLNNQSILILDEAGMVDSQRLHSLLQQSETLGFKVVLVGDPEQLPPIEAGAPTRALMESIGFASLSTVVRQKVDWQKEASQHLAMRQTEKALESYNSHNHIHFTKEAKKALIEDWVVHYTEAKVKDSSSSSLILAYTNEDVKELNELARQEVRKAGLLDDQEQRFIISKPLNLETLDDVKSQGKTFKPRIIKEERSFAVGDQVVFLKNDYGLKVKNGQLAQIIEIQEEIITVQKTDKTTLSFDMDTYNHIDYGYATTIHKSQGSTVDKTFVYATPNLNKHLVYVALTRHKEDVQLYVNTDQIPTSEDLIKALSKEEPKENALDYLLDKNQVLELTLEDQKAFMLRRSLHAVTSYLSWDAIKEVTYKVWSGTKGWLFGDLSAQDLKKDTNIKSSLKDAFFELPQVSLSKQQHNFIEETLSHNNFEIPKDLNKEQYNQLIAHTVSYLKSHHLGNITPETEKTLFAKACYIQCTLKDLATDYDGQHWKADVSLKIATIASHLWHGNPEESLSLLDSSYLSKAIGLNQAYQEQLPKLVEAYQRMFSELTTSQVQTLAEHALERLQISDQLPTKDNLHQIAESFAFKDSSLEATSCSTEKNPKSSALEPLFEKTMATLLTHYRIEDQKEVHLEKTHHLSLEREYL